MTEKSELNKSTKALGRGLSSLLRATPANAEVQTLAGGKVKIQEIPLEQISPGSLQSRKTFEQTALNELASSIREVGVIQPVVVRPLGPGKYELISGERRWRASKMVGASTIPALIREDTDETVLQVSLIENVQRAELNAVERARGYALFRDTFKLSAEEMAKKTGEDRTTVTNYLRILELPPAILDMVQKDLLSMGHARTLLALPDEATRINYANLAMSRAMSVRQLERAVVEAKEGQLVPQNRTAKPKSPTAVNLEEQISSSLGMRVRVQLGAEIGHGTLSIKFSSLDDFDRLMSIFGIATE